jgi:uncharacterized protein (DUF1778 family)
LKKPGRSVAVLFRVTYEEKQELARAAQLDLRARSVSDFVREAALDRARKGKKENVENT